MRAFTVADEITPTVTVSDDRFTAAPPSQILLVVMTSDVKEINLEAHQVAVETLDKVFNGSSAGNWTNLTDSVIKTQHLQNSAFFGPNRGI